MEKFCDRLRLAGHDEVRTDRRQRCEHEAALAHPQVGKGQFGPVATQFARVEDVEIDRARRVARIA